MITFPGKDGLALRVVVGYRPQSTRVPFTVYQQQLEYFEENNNKKEVLDNYDDGLIHDIEGWLTKGNHVVVMIDDNVKLAHSIQGNF